MDLVKRLPPWSHTWIVFFAGILLLLPGTGAKTGITAQDEYWLTFRTPMEMLDQHTWLTPWLDGEPRLKKPPLIYWAIMVSYKLFGISCQSARLWSVLCGAGLAACCCAIYRVLFGTGGLLAGLLALGSFGVAIQGRIALLDMPLACLISMSVLFALHWGKTGSASWLMASSASLGLAFLTKGPVCLLFFLTAAVTAMACFRKWRFASNNRRSLCFGLLLFLLLALPWPLLMASRWPEFFDVVRSQVGQRHLGSIRAGSPFSALGGTLGLFMPWSLLLVGALVTYLRGVRRLEPRLLWLVVWYLASVWPFFFMKSFERYLLPILPAQCVLCAAWIQSPSPTLLAWNRRLVCLSTLLAALTGVFLCAFFLWFRLGTPYALAGLMISAVVLFVGLKPSGPLAVACCTACLWTLLLGVLYPFLGISAMPEDIYERVGKEAVASFNTSQPAMLSILLRRSVQSARVLPNNRLSLPEDFVGYVFVRDPETEFFENAARASRFHVEEAGSFQTFYSRKTWIRFARQDAGPEDWEEAFRTRSLRKLKSRIHYYRLVPAKE